MRLKEQKLIDFRYNNQVKHTMDQKKFARTMDCWAMKGFTH